MGIKMPFWGMWFKMQIRSFNSVWNGITKHVIQNAILVEAMLPTLSFNPDSCFPPQGWKARWRVGRGKTKNTRTTRLGLYCMFAYCRRGPTASKPSLWTESQSVRNMPSAARIQLCPMSAYSSCCGCATLPHTTIGLVGERRSSRKRFVFSFPTFHSRVRHPVQDFRLPSEVTSL
jgi:hypothetical protein